MMSSKDEQKKQVIIGRQTSKSSVTQRSEINLGNNKPNETIEVDLNKEDNTETSSLRLREQNSNEMVTKEQNDNRTEVTTDHKTDDFVIAVNTTPETLKRSKNSKRIKNLDKRLNARIKVYEP